MIVDENKNNDSDDHTIIRHQSPNLGFKFPIITQESSSGSANYLGWEVWGKLEPFESRTHEKCTKEKEQRQEKNIRGVFTRVCHLSPESRKQNKIF